MAKTPASASAIMDVIPQSKAPMIALVALIAAVPVVTVGKTSLAYDENGDPDPSLRWPARLPFVLIGLLVGGSLWYVARRLYGNAGGYVALAGLGRVDLRPRCRVRVSRPGGVRDCE